MRSLETSALPGVVAVPRTGVADVAPVSRAVLDAVSYDGAVRRWVRGVGRTRERLPRRVVKTSRRGRAHQMPRER